MESIRREKNNPSTPTSFVRQWGFSPASNGATNAFRAKDDGDLENYASSGPNGFSFTQNEQPF